MHDGSDSADEFALRGHLRPRQTGSVTEMPHAGKDHGDAVFIGSGVDPDNAKHYAAADGWIVGSYLKRDGHWEHPPELERVRQMADVARSIVR